MTATTVSSPITSDVVASPSIPRRESIKKRVVSEDIEAAILEAAMPAAKRQRITKRVQFHTQTTVQCFDKVENKEEIWYSKDEMRQGMMYDRQMMQQYPQVAQPIRQALTHMVACATNPNVVADERAAAYAADSHFRGNELEMIPYFSQRRKQVMANVLKSQSSMVAWKKNNPEKADKAKQILASHYQKLAASSQKFANMMAAGDAIAARS